MFVAFHHNDANMQRNIGTYAHTFHLFKVKKLKSSISCLEMSYQKNSSLLQQIKKY